MISLQPKELSSILSAPQLESPVHVQYEAHFGEKRKERKNFLLLLILLSLDLASHIHTHRHTHTHTHRHTCLFSQTTSLLFSGVLIFHTFGAWVRSFLVVGPSCANIICCSIRGLYPLDSSAPPPSVKTTICPAISKFFCMGRWGWGTYGP